MTLGLRPCAAMPRYSRAWLSCGLWVWAKNESRRSGPGGGKMSTFRRLNRARICFSARRTVAVEATILGRTRFSPTSRMHSSSRADSYRPTIVPIGPEIRCNSSWMTRSGGGRGAGQRQANVGLAGAVEAVRS